MTVLVGVLCQDGVVVGSDASMTFLAGGEFRTVEQPAEKTFVVAPDVLLAGTGSVGLMQRFQAVVTTLRAKTAEWGPRAHIETAKVISRAMIEDFAFTHAPKGTFGALVAFSTRTNCHLCEFSTDHFQPEFKAPANWFVAMGSGQPITDPFFGLLRRTLFKGKQPRLQEGIFAAMWALSHAIELNPGGINGPPQIGVLYRGRKGEFEAKRLVSEELAEHQSHVEAVEEHLASYCERLNPKQPVTTQPQPKPPDAPLG
jgi:20S proteasome alpha/beta subunit